jgi:signal peptidase I
MAAPRPKAYCRHVATRRGVLIVIAAALVTTACGSNDRVFRALSSSMEPTIDVDQRVRVSDAPDVLEQGDVVLFGESEDEAYIARVIGLPGESVAAENGSLVIDGDSVDEPWLPDDVETPDFGPEELGDQEYLVHGDWRPNWMPVRIVRDEVLGLIDCGESKADC